MGMCADAHYGLLHYGHSYKQSMSIRDVESVQQSKCSLVTKAMCVMLLLAQHCKC